MPLTPDDVMVPSSRTHRAAVEPFTLVVFGASGDLAHRKLLPALCALDCDGQLPAGARILGYGRSDMTDESFRRDVRKSVSLSCNGQQLSDKQWESSHRGCFTCEASTTARRTFSRSASGSGT